MVTAEMSSSESCENKYIIEALAKPGRGNVLVAHRAANRGQRGRCPSHARGFASAFLIVPILLPCEDEIVENTTSFHSVGCHRIYINAVVTSVVIATGKAMLKGAQRMMFCCAPFVLFLRRIWSDGE